MFLLVVLYLVTLLCRLRVVTRHTTTVDYPSYAMQSLASQLQLSAAYVGPYIGSSLTPRNPIRSIPSLSPPFEGTYPNCSCSIPTDTASPVVCEEFNRLVGEHDAEAYGLQADEPLKVRAI